MPHARFVGPYVFSNTKTVTNTVQNSKFVVCERPLMANASHTSSSDTPLSEHHGRHGKGSVCPHGRPGAGHPQLPRRKFREPARRAHGGSGVPQGAYYAPSRYMRHCERCRPGLSRPAREKHSTDTSTEKYAPPSRRDAPYFRRGEAFFAMPSFFALLRRWPSRANAAGECCNFETNFLVCNGTGGERARVGRPRGNHTQARALLLATALQAGHRAAPRPDEFWPAPCLVQGRGRMRGVYR